MTCSFTKKTCRINELKLSIGAADMATAGRAWASWWPLFTASSPPQCDSPSVKEKAKHLDHIPIHCIIHALLSHIKLYSPSAQERGALMRAQHAKYWVKIKTLADRGTQTREDNYIARSKKWTLLKNITLHGHVYTAVLLGWQNQPLNFVRLSWEILQVSVLLPRQSMTWNMPSKRF